LNNIDKVFLPLIIKDKDLPLISQLIKGMSYQFNILKY
jgi:hypothetical protein